MNKDEEIKDIIRRLDELLPKDGAKIKLEKYGGGPDESRIELIKLTISDLPPNY